MEDLMKLLRAKSDSQRLAGLLLVTKICDGSDQRVIVDVYQALGHTFLHRLLVTGIGHADEGGGGGRDDIREAYFKLAVSVLAAFARVPEIAASAEMQSIVPTVLKAVSKDSIPSIIEDCYEFLFLVSTAHKDGVTALYEFGLMQLLACQMAVLSSGSHEMELAIKLAQLAMAKLPGEAVFVDHIHDLCEMVPTIAKEFGLRHDAVKFDALHLLSAILSSNFSGALHEVLRSNMCSKWPNYARHGIVDILQNRVGPTEKLEALAIAESIMTIFSEEWLIGKNVLPDAPCSYPSDRCMHLVLESARVEVAVILNEIAYLKYEASSTPESFLVKLRNLGVVFSLVEKVIKFISKLATDEGITHERTLTKIIFGLDETIGVVLDYLLDAKEHGTRQGNDLLACVRIVGSYLAQAPTACEKKVRELLGYMLTIEGDGESSTLDCISFLLPMMCQMTLTDDGCKTFASTQSFTAVVAYLTSLISPGSYRTEISSSILLALDTTLNVLLKREESFFSLDESCLVKLLKVLPLWAEKMPEEASVVMMASSISSLILKSSEDCLMSDPNLEKDDLVRLSLLLKKSLDES
ncbi:hypothetical protein M569_02070, partial [Genlisea aurea]